MPARLRSISTYAIALTLCLAALAMLLRRSGFDIAVPLRYKDDALVTHVWVKTICETGWYLSNPRLGAPAGMELYDFPLFDNLHFLWIKLLSLFSSDWKVVVNLYFLLTYPLTTLTTVFALRRCGASPASAIVAGLLYAFLPYHAMRSQSHMLLASYYVVPLSVLVALRVYFGGPTASSQTAPPLARTPYAAAAICLLQASAGIYYAFFACFFLLLAGGAASLRQRAMRPLGAATAWIGVTLIGLLLNITPNIAYWTLHGRNPEVAKRYAMQAEMFNLRLTQLVMPTHGHVVPAFDQIRRKYDARIGAYFESQTVALGVVGSIGLGLLLARLAWLGSGRPMPHLLDALALMNVAALLLATSGGLGVIFNMLITPQFRCYARIVVFMAFFALAAVAWGLDWISARWANGIVQRATHLISLGVFLALGIVDQTPSLAATESAAATAAGAMGASRFRQDADFAARIESSLAPRDMVYQLPYLAFPEAPQLERMAALEHLRLYLHSESLRFSFGAMCGRPCDLWQRELAGLSLDRQLEAIVLAGFAGIQIDRRGYADDASALEGELRRLLAVEPITDAAGQRLFFTLVHYSRLTTHQSQLTLRVRRVPTLRVLTMKSVLARTRCTRGSGCRKSAWRYGRYLMMRRLPNYAARLANSFGQCVECGGSSISPDLFG
jgi:phosphoglycerol transferase